MTKLEQLVKSVAALPKEEMDQFADWFDELRAAQWDTQIEIDAANGALGKRAEAALGAHRRGETNPL
jgi:hypothetical protein